MEYILFDVAVVAILAFFVWRGWRKGLLLSLCGLAVVVASFLGAGFIADTLDTPLADAITPKLEETIQEQLALHYDSQSDQDPLDALREQGGLFSWAADAVEDAQESVVGNAIGDLAAKAAGLLATTIAYRILFTLAFLLLFILLTVLLHALNVVARLPGLNFCNELGGGLIGLLKGVIVLYVVIACLRLFSGLITPQVEENTHVLKFFLRFDLVSALFHP